MVQFKDILLVSDMDGTLLGKDEKIHPYNIEKIKEFIALGGNFTVATGRTNRTLGIYREIVPMNVPAITSNGACIYDYESNMFLEKYCSMLDEKAQDMLKDIHTKFPDIGIEVMTREEIYMVVMNDMIAHHLNYEHLSYQEKSISELHTIKEPWGKVLFAQQGERLEELDAYVKKVYPQEGFVRSGDKYFEMIPRNVDKQEGLKNLCAHIGVSMENTFAIGDFYNDIKLLKIAGCSATVAGAPEEIKQAAQMVMGPCEEGAVGEFIHFIIEKVKQTSNK